MKNIVLTLGCILYIASSLLAQNYFYDENRPITISEDQQELVIHFNSQNSFNLVTQQIPDGWVLVKLSQKYKMVVLEAPNKLTDSFTIKSLPGFENLDIRSEIKASQLIDGFNLWLSYEVLLEPKPGITLPNDIQSILSKYEATISRDDFGKYILEVNHPTTSLTCANELVESGLVKWAHPNFYSNHTSATAILYIPFNFK